MTFLPKAELLSLEEIDRLASVFVGLGVRKLRLTGGEPLVRRNVMWLVERLGRHLQTGELEELTVTTNGSQLARFAQPLKDAGVRRINVSLDTLDSARFAQITRWGRFEQVIGGIEAAKAAGLNVKINMVALKGVNDTEFDRMIAWCGAEGYDLVLIETMPLGEVEEDRTDRYLPLSQVRRDLERRWTLTDLPLNTGGPARYARIAETGGRIGFITPLTHNFCEGCNRVRVTCTGTMYMCLGQEDQVDLRTPLRASADDQLLVRAIKDGINHKPKGHDFVIDRRHAKPAVARHMSMTGG